MIRLCQEVYIYIYFEVDVNRAHTHTVITAISVSDERTVVRELGE